MIKRIHLILISVVIVSLVFGSLFLTVAIGKVPQEQPSSKLILVLDDEPVTVATSTTTYHYLASFDPEGYKYAYVMVEGTGDWQLNSNIIIWIFDNAFDIQTIPAGGTVNLNTNDVTRPDWGTGKAKYEVHSPQIDLYLQVYNSDVGFDGAITIAVHLSN